MRVLLVVYDNDAYMHWFPQGLAYIGAVLRNAGHEVEVYSQDMHHWPDEHLKDYLDENRFDVVCGSFIAGYYQYRRLKGLSRAINESRNRPFYVLGGHGPTPEPEFYIGVTGADVIVCGEGEQTIVDLLDRLQNGLPWGDVKGIAYMDGNKCVVTPRHPLIEDLDSIPFPAYDLFPMDYYRLMREPHMEPSDFIMPVLSARGCPFRCTFCYRIDPGYRARQPEGIIDEIEMLKKDYGITYIIFSDELLMSSVNRTLELCEAFMKADIGVKWNCSGRLNWATKEVMKAMKDAGCVFINYGIESVDNEVLKKMKKGLNYDQIIEGVENTLEVGISPGLNIIFGNIGDDRASMKKSIEFLLRYSDGSQMRTIRPVTPYPGSPLYYTAIERGLLKDAHDFYEVKHTNSDLITVNMTELQDDEFYGLLSEANQVLVDDYFEKKRANAMDEIVSLYGERDDSFRGFRHT